MDKRVLYITGFVMLVVWGLPHVFTALLLWGLVSQFKYTDVIIMTLDQKLVSGYGNTAPPPPHSTRPQRLTTLSEPLCQGSFQSGNPCHYRPIQHGYCRRHQPQPASS